MPAAVHAETIEAEDITALAEISPRSPKHGLKSISDRKYTTPWETAERKNPYVQAVLPEDKLCSSLYVCFGKMPSSWEVQVPDGGKWVTLVNGDTRFLHSFIQLPRPVTSLRITVTDKKKTSLLLNELFLFGKGEVPGFVQKWEPTLEKADLLVLVAHPDDELLFMGGTIPRYAVSLKKRVAACYLTSSNTTRSSELLNGLWSMGVRTYPLIGPFGDRYSGNAKDGYDKWGGKEKVQAYVMGVIRKLKPAVIVTHDVNGEYGHGAHQACADAAMWCVEHGADPDADSASYAKYGAWDVPKLYLHLYPENEIVMDWRIPDPALDGRSPLQAAKDAYAFHVTQQNAGTAVIGKDFEVTDEGEFSCSRFGLYRSLVGPDMKKNDFFENIP
jgi:LmbE family N-acetylglucosaminyl deacetylase